MSQVEVAPKNNPSVFETLILSSGLCQMCMMNCFDDHKDQGKNATALINNPYSANKIHITEKFIRSRDKLIELMMQLRCYDNFNGIEDQVIDMDRVIPRTLKGYRLEDVMISKYNYIIQFGCEESLGCLQAIATFQSYCIAKETENNQNVVLNIQEYVQNNTSVLSRHILTDKGVNSKEILRDILQPEHSLLMTNVSILGNLRNYDVGLISSMKIHSDFFTEKTLFYGSPEGVFIGYHAMVLIGWRKTKNGEIVYLVQNNWISKQFIEIDEEYLRKSAAVIIFVRTPQTDIPSHHRRKTARIVLSNINVSEFPVDNLL